MFAASVCGTFTSTAGTVMCGACRGWGVVGLLGMGDGRSPQTRAEGQGCVQRNLFLGAAWASCQIIARMMNAPPGLVKLTLVSVTAFCLTATAAMVVVGLHYFGFLYIWGMLRSHQDDMQHCRERLMPQCQADLEERRASGKAVFDTCEAEVQRQCREWAEQ